jgi:hypothetical protein
MYRGSRYQEYFTAVEKIMTERGGRPHWGKMHTRDAEYLGKVYPRFEDFLGVRDRVDAKRLFANEYTRRVFGD